MSDPAEVLWRVQVAHPAWVLMWSAYRRTFTAFGCFAPVPLVLDDADVDGLVALMRQEELRYGYAALPLIAGSAPSPGAGVRRSGGVV
jgi:hypothetical protein